MGTTSKLKRRTVDFSSAIQQLSSMVDQKLMANMQHITQALSTMKVRVEALEDILSEKLGETPESIQERVILRVEQMQGFQEVNTPVQKGSIIRIKIKEEAAGQENANSPLSDSFMAVGQNQINAEVDKLVIGAVRGETRDVTLPDPNNASAPQRKITVTVMKVFRGSEGNENKNEDGTALAPAVSGSSAAPDQAG